MKKLLRKIYNKCIKQFLPMSFRQKLKRADSIEYPIIKNPEEVFEKVYHIKDATWEIANMPNVYQLCKSWSMAQYCAAQNILQIDNATIASDSDVVITQNGVVWDKASSALFSKTIPCDAYLLDSDRNQVTIRKAERSIEIKGDCISLLGVYADIWSHFIVQYLPKLYYAEEAGLLDNNVTVILPKYADIQISKLVEFVLQKHPNVVKYETSSLADRTAIHCDKLYYMPVAASISNHAEWLSPYDFVIPKRVTDILEKNLIIPLTGKSQASALNHQLIYLVRRGMRGMENVEEVEQYFKNLGFYFVEPHLLSLDEKVSLFYHAKIIVGPQSSAWSNIIFCKQAKGLMFSTICRTLDAYAGYINDVDKIKWLLVTGDDSVSSIHSNYYIPISKIDAAYKQLIG